MLCHGAGGSHLDLTQALSAVEKGGQIKEGKRQEKECFHKKVVVVTLVTSLVTSLVVLQCIVASLL